jgi:4-amino-4-deoxy-L-arabinose transferase-like glycosyltransferase
VSDLKPASCPLWARLLLAAILLFDVWWRGHTFGPSVRDRLGVDLWPVSGAEAEPLDCDEAAYAYIGRCLDEGAVMYRDLTENKPPGGYWLYALAIAVGGSTEWTIRLMPLPMVVLTISLVWWLALRLRGPGAACLAAFLYAVLSTDPYLYGNGANFEHAINLASTASLAWLVWGESRPGRWPLLASGACLGLACLIKQVVVLDAPLFALFLLARSGRGDRGRDRFLDVAVLGGGFLLVWGLSALVLLAQGAGYDAYVDIFQYGRALATDTPPEPNAPSGWIRWVTGNADPQGRLPWPFGRTDYLVWWGTGSWPVWLAAVPAVLGLGLARSSTPARRLVAAWTVSAWVQVALPGLFWQHYYLLPLPGLAVALAVHCADSLERVAWPRLRGGFWGLWAALLLLAVAWTCRLQWRDYLMTPPQELTVRYKGGGQWVALRVLGRELARRSRTWPDARLFVWGWQSPLFFYSGLDGVSRHFFVDNLLKAYAGRNHPLIRPRTERIMRDLRARPPELMFVAYPPFPELRAFLEEGYLPSRLAPGLWVERGKYREFETYPDARAGSAPAGAPSATMRR